MTDVKSEQRPTSGKGKAFFDRADQVAETGNWDFAIEMYVEGIRREPGNLQRGHHPLREVALKRKAQGGKSAGFTEKLKRSRGKEAIDQLLNAEFLLAKDPGSVPHMVATLKAAVKLEEPAVVRWIGRILLEAMRQAKKPSRQICVMLAKSLRDVEAFKQAAAACDIATEAYPNDGELLTMARDLSAMATIDDGKYDKEGDFTQSVADMERQKELAQKDQLYQSRDLREAEIEKARKDYEESPAIPGLIDALADALTKIEEEAYENEAIAVLEKAYRDTKAYRFKLRSDDIRMKQMRRQVTQMRDANQAERAKDMARQLLRFELDTYGERAREYPTDHNIKYELGRRQLAVGQVDDAIPSLQQAQRDAKRRIAALTLLGDAFGKKGWHQQAVENYQKALESEPGEERSKDLHYRLGKALEDMGEKAKALDHFSEVAQMDYTYKDVRERIEALRKEVG